MARFTITSLAAMLLLTFFTALSTQAQNTYNYTFEGPSDPCKVFIGVGTSSVGRGVKVDYTLENTPAREYGVKVGDVILSLDGAAVNTQSELINERDKHKAGDAFALQIVRDGKEMTINARFKQCSEEDKAAFQQEKGLMELAQLENLDGIRKQVESQMATMRGVDRPILGVYENEEAQGDGLTIEKVIAGKGAAAAGLQAGDVIVMVDGKEVTGSGSLRGVLADHKPGDNVTVVYLRDGENNQVKVSLSRDNTSFHFSMERDPCQVFIGVYTGGNGEEGRGTRVTGVINGTPADESKVREGDVILAFNGKAVNSYSELTAERDKCKPGEAFKMTVLRDGSTITVNARFKACDAKTQKEENVETLQEPVAIEERKDPTAPAPTEVLDAYPNPTFGPVNIRFQAEAVPTSVRIYDLSGKVVYTKELPRFDGNFSEQVNLFGNQAGNYIISVQQGDKIRTKQVTLMPRA